MINATSYIGKLVSVTGNTIGKITTGTGDDKQTTISTFRYAFGDDVVSGTLTVKDANGNTVYSEDLAGKAGGHDIRIQLERQKRRRPGYGRRRLPDWPGCLQQERGGCSCRPGCRCHGHRRGQSERRRFTLVWMAASFWLLPMCARLPRQRLWKTSRTTGKTMVGKAKKPNEPETGSDGDKVEGSNVESLATARKAMIRGDSSGSGRQQRIGATAAREKAADPATAAKPQVSHPAKRRFR